MKIFFGIRTRGPSGRDETIRDELTQSNYYRVTKDGALVLDSESLLKTNKMRKQIEAARELKEQSVYFSNLAFKAKK